MVRYTLEQRVFLYDNYVKYGSARKCRRKFRDETVPSRQTIHNLVNTLRTTGLLIDKHNRRVLTENLDGTGARIKYTFRKSLKCLAQETGVLKSSARTAIQLLKLRPCKTTVIQALQLRDPAGRVHFCSWFLQSVVEGEIDLQLTFVSDDACFHLQGYIVNMQNNRYRSSQNPHLIHEVLLHPLKVGVWCAVSARIVVPVFFNETIAKDI
jgi:hypothetical protein